MSLPILKYVAEPALVCSYKKVSADLRVYHLYGVAAVTATAWGEEIEKCVSTVGIELKDLWH